VCFKWPGDLKGQGKVGKLGENSHTQKREWHEYNSTGASPSLAFLKVFAKCLEKKYREIIEDASADFVLAVAL